MSDRIFDTTKAREKFEMTGTSVSEWARARGFSAILVYQVLDGQRKCRRGQSHKIAVALGLKEGLVMDIDELSRQLIANTAITNLEK